MSAPFWKGFAAYVLPTFPLGYVWHLELFAERYHRLELYRAEVLIPLGLSSMLIQGAFFSWAYPRMFPTERTAWRGSALRCAAALFALAFSFVVLPVAAKYRMASVADFIALETSFTALQFAVVAPLLALAHRRPA